MSAEDLHPHVLMDAKALDAAVENTAIENHDVSKGIHDHGDAEPAAQTKSKRHQWLEKLIPGIENVTVNYHGGNYVAIRDPSKPPGTEKFFESMPIYARIGMHILFYGKEQIKLLEGGKLDGILREKSIKQGEIYDKPESAASIPSFIKTYSLDASELLEPDPSKYRTFNEFFSRKLKPDARPLQNADPYIVSSAADCRLTVFQTLEEAQTVWIKGNEFTIPVLLHGPSTSHSKSKSLVYEENPPYTITPTGCSLAIFRLAPADYHRFHSPVSGTIVHGPVDIPGTYYTVNPQAVTEVDFDVFTGNRRQTLYIEEEVTRKVIAFVAVGALLVGSIGWSKAKGEKVTRGEELGWFAYGGSTVITVFPAQMIQFDEDLRTNSASALETYVKVGYNLGRLL